MNRRNVNEQCHHQESAKLACGIDDLLLSTEGGKHDYDWLLTPPGTPDFPSSKGESKPTLVPPRSSLGRPTSNTNISRVSASHNQSRPTTRSSSVTRPTISSSNRTSSILNNRLSSPITRSPSATRSSTPSRPSRTPSRAPSSSEKSRPSTPSQILVVPPDFPLETPPNLRTTLPHRPVSAGRSRPGANAATLKPNSDTQASVTTMSRTQSSPVVSKERFSAYTGKSQSHGPEVVARKCVKASTSATDNNNNGFGRTISKKSLDMAIRHMDTRKSSSGSVRSVPSPTLFPQSIRSSTPKLMTLQPNRGLSSVGNDIDRSLQSRNNRISGRGREKDERQ